jgi:competence ComEA-like helix-hairpin-helix protein
VEHLVTREERNVLLFLAFGILLGSLPYPRGEPHSAAESPEARSDGQVEIVDLFPIDLNHASAELLEELPGIGPAKARAILALREERGGFARVEELEDVRGIGPRTIESLRPLVSIREWRENTPDTTSSVPREGRVVDLAARESAPGQRDRHPGRAREDSQTTSKER